ncbi:hypothetical protein BAUCODRAFT_438929 [Baudoinia panamericana UAMH 10762]|uniref:Uncharacterized protein n=1 Tax=Baudoinia panamericana (strain UAMH 10762) TaxID=717646 RepID=M2NDX6_BAUPA|nr:uncharacterized protein BAUCODRAFT_438929 [Baudoinia panamericana UAMH 10762]EMC97120.1 hypothetical protein BAUCODRAFT_438929 [Baudoinia panamericana UAMH 10762]
MMPPQLPKPKAQNLAAKRASEQPMSIELREPCFQSLDMQRYDGGKRRQPQHTERHHGPPRTLPIRLSPKAAQLQHIPSITFRDRAFIGRGGRLSSASLEKPSNYPGHADRPPERSARIAPSTPYGRHDAAGALPSRASHHDADFGTFILQHEHNERRPLHHLPLSQTDRRPPKLLTNDYVPATPGHPKSTHAPSTSLLSPFFKRGVASSAALQRPPTRGSLVQPAYMGGASRLLRSLTRLPSRKESTQPDRYRQSLNGLSFIEQPHDPADHRPLYRSPEHSTRVGEHNDLDESSSQMLRNRLGLFELRDRTPASSGYRPIRLQSRARRGRISLLPDQAHSLSFSGCEEQTLSKIRGVRGLSSHDPHPSRYTKDPLYDTVRPVFTSAGGRRSVRR